MHGCLLVVLVIGSFMITANGFGQSLDFDRPPIAYASTESNDPVAKLIGKLESGKKVLNHDAVLGWLPSLLNALDVPDGSQLLVFSKTSLQIRKISPSNPRAIYFNDNVYIAYIPRADRIEISAVDSLLGAVFYTLDADIDSTDLAAAIVRDDSCLSCHGTRKTQSVPGFLVRSVFPMKSGLPRFELGTTTTDATTPFEQRFGGWYVTGTHGDLRHRGNAFILKGEDRLDLDAEANRTELPKRVDRASYPTDSSDIVALMVLEHQAQTHNAITKAAYAARASKHHDQLMNDVLERDKDFVSESTGRRIAAAGDNLIDHLLFRDEFKLTSPVQGNSGFQAEFEKRGPWDDSGRSLRHFDLQTRMFKYPCSYLIYSPSFDALPQPMLDYVYGRLREILKDQSGEDDDFADLTASDRQSIWEILTATKPAFAEAAKR